MELRINQKAYQVDAEADTPLLWVIRDNLGMTGTKYGCGLAQCGACSVLVDGNVVSFKAVRGVPVEGGQFFITEGLKPGHIVVLHAQSGKEGKIRLW